MFCGDTLYVSDTASWASPDLQIMLILVQAGDAAVQHKPNMDIFKQEVFCYN
jgi:hypothetical protein